jgi:hypothetical protein
MTDHPTEAERQAKVEAERKSSEKAAAEQRTAEVNAGMNRLLRGQPSPEQAESTKRLNETTKARLEAIAQDEDEDEETRQWALDVLDGKEPLMANEKKRKPVSADGGEGQHSPAVQRNPGDAFNDMIRTAYGHPPAPWWLPS